MPTRKTVAKRIGKVAAMIAMACVGVTAGVTALSTTAVAAVGGVALLVVSTIGALRHHFATQHYTSYSHKRPQDISALTATQRQAFTQGRRAAKSSARQIVGLLLGWQAYRAPKAYYAGYVAESVQDKSLIARIPTV
jgi:hypothetical protein